jgi:spore germination protein KA
VLLPGIYVCVPEYHGHLIQLRFLITIINATHNLPMSAKYEMLITIIFFEVLHESSIRMPRYVGMAISVVGALVLGETGVRAGLLSSSTVLIAAMSGIALYNMPDSEGTLSILRILFTVIGGAMGLYGMLLAGMLLITYLITLDSFGSPYIAPYAPLIKADMKDVLMKRNLKDLKKRPESIPNINKTRLVIEDNE